MKKFITIMILIAIIFAVGGCTGSEEQETTTTPPPNTVTVTFPEGFTVEDIAKRLEENNVCSAAEFLVACDTPYEGIAIENADERVYLLEGYVFPDTYEFYFNSDVKTVLKKFIDNYDAKVTDEIKAKASALGYTMDEMLTLASIIQKECDQDPAECANVSSVFHNRLKRSDFPKLQSDVTTFYITKNLAQTVGYQSGIELDKQTDEVKNLFDLYSTYYCKGLPAGPICNPGIKAINAAVSPADTDYVYFLTDATGEDFYYASTLAEHQKNGRKAGIF